MVKIVFWFLLIAKFFYSVSWATPPLPLVYVRVKGQRAVVARDEKILFQVSSGKSQGEPERDIRIRIDIEAYKLMTPKARIEDVFVEPRRFTLRPGPKIEASQDVLVKATGDGWFMVKVFAENAPYQQSGEPIQTYFIISRNNEVLFGGAGFDSCLWQSLLKKHGLPLGLTKQQLPLDKLEIIEKEYRRLRKWRLSVEEVGTLIEKFVHDEWDGDTMDWISPYYGQIADKGYNATIALLDALVSQDPDYIEKQADFVYLLGQIGDSDAYIALREWFLSQFGEAAKWRGAISLGACLAPEFIEDYVKLLLADTLGGGLRALREMSGQDFGVNIGAWVKYLKSKGHLEEFRANCRQRSKPILG